MAIQKNRLIKKINKCFNIPCRTTLWRLETIHNASRIPSLHMQFSCDHVIKSTRPLVRLLVGVQSTTDWAQTGTQKWGGCQPQVHRLHRHTIHTAHITLHTPSTQHTLYNVHLKLLLAPMEHHTKNIGHYPYNPPQHRSADSTPLPASSYSLTPQQPSVQTQTVSNSSS